VNGLKVVAAGRGGGGVGDFSLRPDKVSQGTSPSERAPFH
jgi:hypothetical protein